MARNQKNEQTGKNPFNFNVPDNFEIIRRHDYEQKPIQINNDEILRLIFQILNACKPQLKS